MALVSLDSNICIWGIKEQCTKGQEIQKEKAKKLIKRLYKAKHNIILPSPVISEILSPMPNNEAAVLYAKIIRKFEIGYMDTAASLILSKILNYNYKLAKPNYKDIGITKTCMKYDAYITSIAIAAKAECIFTNDTKDFKSLVGNFIEIKGLDEMPSSDELLKNMKNEEE